MHCSEYIFTCSVFKKCVLVIKGKKCNLAVLINDVLSILVRFLFSEQHAAYKLYITLNRNSCHLLLVLLCLVQQ